MAGTTAPKKEPLFGLSKKNARLRRLSLSRRKSAETKESRSPVGLSVTTRHLNGHCTGLGSVGPHPVKDPFFSEVNPN